MERVKKMCKRLLIVIFVIIIVILMLPISTVARSDEGEFNCWHCDTGEYSRASTPNCPVCNWDICPHCGACDFGCSENKKRPQYVAYENRMKSKYETNDINGYNYNNYEKNEVEDYIFAILVYVMLNILVYFAGVLRRKAKERKYALKYPHIYNSTKKVTHDDYSREHQHVHSFTRKMVQNEYLCSAATCTSPAIYYYSCLCGEKGNNTFPSGQESHNYTKKEVSQENLRTEATCQRSATYYYVCEKCGKRGNEYFSAGKKSLEHKYTKRNMSKEYFRSKATCLERATYYYSCEFCGDKGTEYFYGEKGDHIIKNNVCVYCHRITSDYNLVPNETILYHKNFGKGKVVETDKQFFKVEFVDDKTVRIFNRNDVFNYFSIKPIEEPVKKML